MPNRVDKEREDNEDVEHVRIRNRAAAPHDRPHDWDDEHRERIRDRPRLDGLAVELRKILPGDGEEGEADERSFQREIDRE